MPPDDPAALPGRLAALLFEPRNDRRRMTEAETADFSPEQRRYLEGLVAGMTAARSVVAAGPATSVPSGPDAPHLLAMARTEAEGKKLVDQETFKRDEHPHDAYHRLKSEAA